MGHLDATGQGGEADGLNAQPAQDPLVVADRPVRPEAGSDRLVALVSLDDLGDGPDGQLRAEAEPLAHVVVDQLLQLELVGQPVRVGDPGDRVAGGVEALHRRQQDPGQLGGRGELQRDRLLHTSMCTTETSMDLVPAGCTAWLRLREPQPLPRLKAGASCGGAR
jgi:hypothetical protein